MEQVGDPEPPTAAAPADPPGMVAALKQRFAADLAERDLRHRAEIAARDEHWRGELAKLQASYTAHDAGRNSQHAAQLGELQQKLSEMHAALTAADDAREQEMRARGRVEAELHARQAQIVAQHLELDTARGEIAQLVARVAELSATVDAERQASAQSRDRVERLEAKLRVVAGQSHDAALDAAGRLADAVDAYEEAVKRGDHISEQVAFHEAAVEQMRATIESQRAAHEKLLEERQAARARCVELESQLHALTSDARHLAEGLQRVQAERDEERRAREEQVPAVSQPPRLRLAGAGETA